MRNLLRRVDHKSSRDQPVVIQLVDLFALSLVSRHKVGTNRQVILTFVEGEGRVVCLSVLVGFLSKLRLVSVASFPDFLLAFRIFSAS